MTSPLPRARRDDRGSLALDFTPSLALVPVLAFCVEVGVMAVRPGRGDDEEQSVGISLTRHEEVSSVSRVKADPRPANAPFFVLAFACVSSCVACAEWRMICHSALEPMSMRRRSMFQDGTDSNGGHAETFELAFLACHFFLESLPHDLAASTGSP